MLLLSSMKYATCSIMSTVLSSVVVSPLDVLRTRNQAFNMYHKGVFFTIRDVLKKEGIKGWYRGLPGTLLSAPFFWSIYLPLYDHLKEKESLEKVAKNMNCTLSEEPYFFKLEGVSICLIHHPVLISLNRGRYEVEIEP